MATVHNNLALVFPGQGSQTVGMLADLAGQFEQIGQTFAQASEVLGYDLWALSQNGEQEQLNMTETTQPLLLTASVAMYRAWQAAGGGAPVCMAGHSLGEFSALVCAGTLRFEDAVALVRQRGQFMQTAVPVGEGAMAAIIGLDDEAVQQACSTDNPDQVVEAVNFNAPGQVVIAGHSAAVEKAIENAKAAGAKRAMPLPVSAPFHTSLMRPAGEKLAEAIAELPFEAPRIPVVHNVTAASEDDPERIRALLIEQIYSPVNWTGCMRTMLGQGVQAVLECGPGKVLCGLARRVDKSLEVAALDNPETMQAQASAFST